MSSTRKTPEEGVHKNEENFLQTITINLSLFFILLVSACFPVLVWVNPIQNVSPVVLGIICLVLLYIFRNLLKRAVDVHKNIEKNRGENSFGKKIAQFYFAFGAINFIFYLNYLFSKPAITDNSIIQVLTLFIMGLIAYQVLKKRTPEKAGAEIMTSTNTAA
jgi:L-asparagine transporter-like permease